MEGFGSLKIGAPPLGEQTAICDWIDEALVRLEDLNNEAKRAIAILKERRAALISAAVTGKIDVRGVVPDARQAA